MFPSLVPASLISSVRVQIVGWLPLAQRGGEAGETTSLHFVDVEAIYFDMDFSQIESQDRQTMGINDYIVKPN